MTDKPDTQPASTSPDLPSPDYVEAIPGVRGGISAIASANAPFIYFENAPYIGHTNGAAQITLVANRIFGSAKDGSAIIDRVIVAHLRCNLEAVRALRSACDSALLLAEPKPEGPAN